MQLMAPHFKCTLEINRQARKLLICAGGQIETHFTTRAYSMEMGAAHYRDAWTFESQALPKDLVARYLPLILRVWILDSRFGIGY